MLRFLSSLNITKNLGKKLSPYALNRPIWSPLTFMHLLLAQNVHLPSRILLLMATYTYFIDLQNNFRSIYCSVNPEEVLLYVDHT